MDDYIAGPTPHDNFGSGKVMWVVWAQITNGALPLALICWIFFSFSRGDIYTETRFQPKMCFLWVSTISDYI